MGNKNSQILRVNAFSDPPLDIRFDEIQGIYILHKPSIPSKKQKKCSFFSMNTNTNKHN